jgi:enoyl-CoA hydratase/carnithine racemase
LSFAALFRTKVHGPVLRKIFLEGHRFTPQEAHAAGFVDHIVAGGTAAVLQKAEEVADSVAANAQTGVWGLMKAS